jgi:glycosyltransferase involved in cell wall biosynthesis
MKVSVIIPVYNRQHSIERAVRSALNQTMGDLEVLVCDDGSTDNTKAVVDAIGDARIRWISGRVGHRPAVPRNEGFKQIRGEWVAYLDSDDEWRPEKLAVQLVMAETGGWSAVSTNAIHHVKGRGEVGVYLTDVKSPLTFEGLLAVNHVITSTVLIKPALVEQCGGFPETDDLVVAQDYGLWLRVASRCDIGFIDQPLAVYYDNEADSVRARETISEYEKRKNVVKNFLTWAIPQSLPQVRLAFTALETLVTEQNLLAMQTELAAVKKELATLRASHSYRLGHALMTPLRYLAHLRSRA